ncbi:hypothetical protein IQ266_03200 [filamentous cyanobacterium LEGE 11480]|uniref:Uncharacterized protein n=1 Tax=Romeriopsis navalis LEGE 11480 TaxID=2777977 RepID=A0A928VLK7_9CYAN|nr:hypothetical protein [Romeriopsis navalis]MBE9028765.1 hypothetical protein [Romeriopsis navalis LEGE 11480]
MKNLCATGLISISEIGIAAIMVSGIAQPAAAQSLPASDKPKQAIDVPDSLKASPTLEKWRTQIPNVAQDIKTDPAFRPRLRLGYQSFGDRSSNPTGWQIGLEDLRLGQTRATLSAEYSSNANGNDRDLSADLHYSLMPLGQTVQIAPTVGYRRLTVNNLATSGLNLGWRTRLILSRRSAADITFDQTWVAPGTDRETGRSKLSFGYAITKNIRIATDWQRQQSRQRKDDRWGLSLEWMP